MEVNIDKSLMLDTSGRPLTQSLFLEIGYQDAAVYTLKEQDHEYKGKTYPSLKRLYLEMEDPTEYEFANRYLLNWKHWQRLYQNQQLRPHIDEWRDELDLKLRAQAFRDMVSLSVSEGGNFSATKWLADRGWDKRAAGRPSKSEKEKDQRINDRILEDFDNDVKRMGKVVPIGEAK